MGRTSKWGKRTFVKGNPDDDRVKAKIMEKIAELGEDPDDPNKMQPDDIHALDKAWQVYTAASFGKVVRECRKALAEGADRDAFDNEEDVVPPNYSSMRTVNRGNMGGGAGRGHKKSFTQDGDDDDDEQNENAVDTTFGSNNGCVVLPYVWVCLIHPPANGERGRSKRVHLLMQFLSGTGPQGYTVGVKGSSLTFAHQKGVEHIFWGKYGRSAAPKGIVRDGFSLIASDITNNFTSVPSQNMIVTFPFRLTSITKRKNFSVEVQPGCPFLGTYLEIRVDWIDEEAEQSGGEFFNIGSPLPGKSSFYDDNEDEDDEEDNEGNDALDRVKTASKSTRYPSHSTSRTSLGNSRCTNLYQQASHPHHGTSFSASNKSFDLAGGDEEAILLSMLLKKFNIRAGAETVVTTDLHTSEKENQPPVASVKMANMAESSGRISGTPSSTTKNKDGYFKNIFGKFMSPDETATTATETAMSAGVQHNRVGSENDLSYSDGEQEVYNQYA